MRLVVAVSLLQCGASIPFVVRTPPGSSHVASNMIYDQRHDTLYMTGSTTGSDIFFSSPDDDTDHTDDQNCILGILQLPQWTGDKAKWVLRRSIGTAEGPESCSAILASTQGNKRQMAIAGYGSSNVLQDDVTKNVGFILDLAWHGTVKSGYVLRNFTNYRPTHISEADSGDVFVAYSSSHVDSLSNGLLQRLGRKSLSPDELFSTTSRRYDSTHDGIFDIVQGIAEGNIYGESFDQYSFLQELWTERWQIQLENFDVAGMVTLEVTDDLSAVLIAGNTRSNSILQVFDGNTGIIRRSVELNIRILDLCLNDSQHVYVVGSPNMHQVTLKKIDLKTFNTLWTRPLEVSHVDDVSCAVTSDSQLVYLAGTAYTDSYEETRGRLLASQFHSHDGHLRYSHHIDYGENYRLVDVVADKYGNAILMANVLRNDSQSSIIIVSVDRMTGELIHSQSDGEQSKFWESNFEKSYIAGVGILTISILISMYLACTRRNLKPDPNRDGILKLVRNEKVKNDATTDEESHPILDEIDSGYKDGLKRLDRIRLQPLSSQTET